MGSRFPNFQSLSSATFEIEVFCMKLRCFGQLFRTKELFSELAHLFVE